MFNHIMVPVDLVELDKLKFTLEVAASEARHYSAQVTLVGIAGGFRAMKAQFAADWQEKMEALAAEMSARHGIEVVVRVDPSADPTVELTGKLLAAIDEIGADLVIMGTHRPGWTEYIFNSFGGKVASHAKVSVVVVREPAEGRTS